MNFKQTGLNLVAVSIFSMLLALVSMSFLYYIRNGHMPMPEVWSRWGKSANVIGKELKNAAGIKNTAGDEQINANTSPEGQGMRQAATTNEGVRRCTIDGKTVYSDTLCLDNNPTTKKIKLNDSQGLAPARAAVANDDTGNNAANSNGAAGIAGTPSNQELKNKIMEQALGRPVAASSAVEQDLHLKSVNRAIDRSTR